MQGFYEALEKGTLAGAPITGIRFVLTDGLAHIVDSSELAFRLAVIGAIREVYFKAQPVILEPIMTVEVIAPTEFQSNVIGGINTRRGTILNSEVREDEFTVTAEVPLSDMFGYSNALRGATQGKGEFTMEYKVCRYTVVLGTLLTHFAQTHQPVLPNVQKELAEAYKKSLPQAKK